MLDTRASLTTFLQNNAALAEFGLTVIQEDEFSSETQKPTLIITYDGSDEIEGTLFRMERWDIWIVSENADYWTIGKIASTLRKELDRTTPDYTTGQDAAAVRLKWVGDGPAVPDNQYRVHTQIQNYTAVTFDVAP